MMKVPFFDVIQRAKKIYARQMEPVCQRWDLNRNELDVLLFLLNNLEYDRAADIVTHRGIAKSHVSMAVNELQRRGFLRGENDQSDRRTVHLKLLDRGRMAAEEGREQQRIFFTGIFQGLSWEEMEAWQQITEKVCRNVEGMENE